MRSLMRASYACTTMMTRLASRDFTAPPLLRCQETIQVAVFKRMCNGRASKSCTHSQAQRSSILNPSATRTQGSPSIMPPASLPEASTSTAETHLIHDPTVDAPPQRFQRLKSHFCRSVCTTCKRLGVRAHGQGAWAPQHAGMALAVGQVRCTAWTPQDSPLLCRMCGSPMTTRKPEGEKEWRHVCSNPTCGCGKQDARQTLRPPAACTCMPLPWSLRASGAASSCGCMQRQARPCVSCVFV